MFLLKDDEFFFVFKLFFYFMFFYGKMNDIGKGYLRG